MRFAFGWKRWIIVALLPWLAGCSTLRLAYNQGVELVYWWAHGYIDFTAEQRPKVRAALKEWFAWHRESQLPDYAALLAKMRAEIVNPATPEQVCRWWDELEQRGERAYERAVPAMARLLPMLEPVQLEHLEAKFERNNAAFREDFLQDDAQERLKAAVKRTVERAESLYGRLDDAQRQRVRERVAVSPFDGATWLAERQQRQREILRVLKALRVQPADAAAAEAALRGLQAQMANSPRPAYAAYQQRLQAYNCAFAAELHNTTSAAQRQQAALKLKGWEDDLRSLYAAP